MRLLLVTLLGIVSCGKTDQDSSPAHTSAGANAGGAAAVSQSTASAGAGGGQGGSPGTAGSAVMPAAGTAGTSSGSGGTPTTGTGGRDSAGAGGDGAGGEAETIDLDDYSCQSYSEGECVDGTTSESYACCPLEGDAPCLTGFRRSNGEDFRCGKGSCACDAQLFYEVCFDSGTPCRELPKCRTVWRYEHSYEGEHPGVEFNDYATQISLDSVNCGGIGIGLDNHRVGSFVVNGLEDCWLRGTHVTSQFLIGTKDGLLERLAPPMNTPPFETFGARRLEIDVLHISWDIDSVAFKVVWRAVACE